MYGPRQGEGGGYSCHPGEVRGVRGRCAAERLACEPQTYFPSSLLKYVCCSQATEGPEGFKTSPCLRQKMFISPPCLRKEISSECMEQHFPCQRPSVTDALNLLDTSSGSYRSYWEFFLMRIYYFFFASCACAFKTWKQMPVNTEDAHL